MPHSREQQQFFVISQSKAAVDCETLAPPGVGVPQQQRGNADDILMQAGRPNPASE